MTIYDTPVTVKIIQHGLTADFLSNLMLTEPLNLAGYRSFSHHYTSSPPPPPRTLWAEQANYMPRSNFLRTHTGMTEGQLNYFQVSVVRC